MKRIWKVSNLCAVQVYAFVNTHAESTAYEKLFAVTVLKCSVYCNFILPYVLDDCICY